MSGPLSFFSVLQTYLGPLPGSSKYYWTCLAPGPDMSGHMKHAFLRVGVVNKLSLISESVAEI
jgi:hypothetical protein